jgi:hypothetical protein
MSKLKFGDSSLGSFGFKSLSTMGPYSAAQYATRVNKEDGSVSVLAPQNAANDSAVSIDLNRLIQSVAQIDEATANLSAALQEDGSVPEVTGNTLQEADAKAALSAETLGDFWDRGVSSLDTIVGKQIDTLTTLQDERLTADQRTALETEFSTLREEYDRVYTTLSGESRRSWDTPSGFTIPFASDFTYSSVEIATETLSLQAGTGTTVSMTDSVSTTTTALSTGSGSTGSVLDVIGSVSSADDTITILSHGLSVGDFVHLELPDTAPGGLAEGTDYYAIIVDSNTIKLATSSVNATAGTAIDITSDGSGALRVLSGVTADFQLSSSFSTLAFDTPGSTTRINVSSSGTEANAGYIGAQGSLAATSADGRYIVFSSLGSNLVAGDANNFQDIFLRDTLTGTTTLVSTTSAGAQRTAISYNVAISANGRYVAFTSYGQFAAEDTDSNTDVYIKDTVTGTATLVSSNSAGVQNTGVLMGMSSDGRYVTFKSTSSNLVSGDTNGISDLFLKDTVTGTTTRVSTDSSGTQISDGTFYGTYQADISADGRYVTFASTSSTLVAGDTNGTSDIFRKDTQTGAVIRISTDSSGVQSNGLSLSSKMSSDGRYVVFRSGASNLVAGDTNGEYDVFVKDTISGTTTRVNTNASGVVAGLSFGEAFISDDGRYVAFNSQGGGLISGVGGFQTYLKDTTTGAITLASSDSVGTQGNSGSTLLGISGDGTKVLMISGASNLVAGDTNGIGDYFLKNLGTNNAFNATTDEVTLTGSSLTTGDRVRFSGSGGVPSGLSKDVDYFAIATGTPDVYKLASNYANAIDGTAIDFSGVESGAINAEYNYSTSTTTDSIIKSDHGLTTGTRIRISSAGTAPGGVSEYTDYYAIADDANSFRLATSLGNATAGTAIDFTSAPTGTLNIVALGGGTNAFNATTDEIALRAHGFSTGQTIQFTGSGTTPTGLSKNTDYFVIQGGDANTLKVASSYANALAGTAIDFSGAASGDLSITTSAVQPSSGLSTKIGNIFDVNTTDVSAASDSLTISSHGLATGDRLRIEVPSTAPGGLAEAVDYYAIIVDSNTIKLATSSVNASAGTAINITSSGTGTIRVLSQVTGGLQVSPTYSEQAVGERQATRVSTTSAGGEISYFSSLNPRATFLSTTGRYIAYVSTSSELVSGDTNNVYDVFVKDTQTGAVARVNTDSSGSQTSGTSLYTDVLGISGDGRYVLFKSDASNLVAGDTNNVVDIFVKDTISGTTTRVNTDSTGIQANSSNYLSAKISSDGRYVVFSSDASNLVAGDTNGKADAFRKDLVTGTTIRVSTDSLGNQTTSPGVVGVTIGGTSSDGRYVLFSSAASTLVAGDTNVTEDVFLKDTVTGTTTRVSTNSSGSQSNYGSVSIAMDLSDDGRYVVFTSNASNLVAGDTNSGYRDIFVKDIQTGTTTRVNTSSTGAESFNIENKSPTASISNDGRYVVFNSSSSTLVTGDTNTVDDVFLRDLTTGTTTRISTSTSGAQLDLQSYRMNISGDGRFVSFISWSSNVVAGDTNTGSDAFIKELLPDGATSSFNSTTDEITMIGSNLTTGSLVRFTGSGTTPTGLSKDTDYYVITTGASDVYKLATTYANALSNTSINFSGSASGSISAQYNFAISPSTDSFTYASHGLTTGTRVRLSTSGSLASGLSSYTDYYAIATDANTFKLATSAVNASLGTAIDFTTSGTGTVNIVSLAVGGTSNAFDASTDTVTQSSHGLTTGQKIRFTGSGSTPTGLSKDTDYYVTGTTTNTFKVATSYANALAATSIDFSGAASGNIFLNSYLTDTRSVGTGTGGSGNIGTMVEKVSTTNDTLTIANHGLTVGNRIRLEFPGTSPAGLAEGTDYYAIIVDSNTIKVATSSVNATAGTAIDITTTGTGSMRALTGITAGFQVTTGNISTGSDNLTITGHGLTTGSRIRLTTSGAVPSGASAYTDYYAIVDDANTIRLATSTVNASAGTAIDLTSVGSGVLDVSVLGGSGISAFNTATDEITKTAHGLATGERIRFSGAGAAPTGLSKNTDYYVIQGGDANTFKVATSYANALASTAIDFSGAASGALSLLTYTTTNAFDPASDTVTATGSNLTTGQRIQFSNRDGTLATGLSAGVDYYAIRVNNNEFKVATSLANAMASTAIDFTGTGSGTTYVTGLSGTSAFDATTNAISVSSSNSLTTGQAVTISSTSSGLGYLPTGLSAGTYYVIKDSSTSIRLATSSANASAGTAVDFTSSGSLGVKLEAYSETSTTRSGGTQALFNLSSNDGRQSASATLTNLENSLSVARTTSRTGNSRTKWLAAYSRAKSGN